METATQLLHRADRLHQKQHLPEAVTLYRRAVERAPVLLEAWYGLGCALAGQGAYADAAEALRQAVLLRPDATGARCNLAEALFEQGRVDEAVAEYGRVVRSGDSEVAAVAAAALACIAPGASQLDNAAIQAMRRRWVALAGRDIRPLPPAPVPTQPCRKLRVGYVSAFFGARNWMKPVWGVINRHDRDRFEIHLLSDGADPSAEGGYVDHPEDRIWQVAGLPNAELAHHVRQAGLDVLVDLNGYSRQPRMPLFLHRPVRRQIAWFNMYATSGMDAFDLLVGDAAVLPPAEETHYTERVARVPGSYLAFEVLYPVPDVAPPPLRHNGFLTFGSLGSAYKLTDQVIAAWARILRAIPGARLVLRNRALDDASDRAALLARFLQRGVDAHRLTLLGAAEHHAFLRTYDQIDIALDTFPYNGGTTTTEALWQGVPVLTFNGDRWAARTSRSLLLAAGLDDWVAASESDYINTAIRLSSRPELPAELSALRHGMRARLSASAACDTATLCRSLEQLYRS